MCEEGCTYFYAQVLIYGVGIPFILVIASSLLGPKSRSDSHEGGRDVKDYGTCRNDEAASLVEYAH